MPQLRQRKPASLNMWTKFLFAPAVVMSGQWQKTNGAKADLFVSPVAPEELQQSVKKISAYLGMATLQMTGSHQLMKTARLYFRGFGCAVTPIA